MDFKLTEQQRSMVATVRDLVEGEFKPNAQKYMDGTFPVAEHEEARRARRARHVGAGGIRRAGI